MLIGRTPHMLLLPEPANVGWQRRSLSVGHRGFQVGLPEPLLQRPRADALFLVTEGDECLAELVQFPRALDLVLSHKVLQDAQEVALHVTVLSWEDQVVSIGLDLSIRATSPSAEEAAE
jgi:hypothetical protein